MVKFDSYTMEVFTNGFFQTKGAPHGGTPFVFFKNLTDRNFYTCFKFFLSPLFF